jgi:hypothetical protein
MIPAPSGMRVWLPAGRTDMRRGMNGLALQVQQVLGRDPHAGDLYVFRGARGDLIKILWPSRTSSEPPFLDRAAAPHQPLIPICGQWRREDPWLVGGTVAEVGDPLCLPRNLASRPSIEAVYPPPYRSE